MALFCAIHGTLGGCRPCADAYREWERANPQTWSEKLAAKEREIGTLKTRIALLEEELRARPARRALKVKLTSGK